MIKKFYEINKIDNSFNFFLFYGKNEGSKKEEILKIISKNKDREISHYDEKNILENNEIFFNEILSKSLFNSKKIIIINRASDKFTKIIEELIPKNISDILIIINAGILEKKSKLRILFEKGKNLVCIPFYPDTPQILSNMTIKFLKEKKINISQANINLIVNRSNGDREVLKNELIKIEHYSVSNKKLTTENILKLTNLIENFSISELIDNCLAKNNRKTVNILNENHFNNEDCILITRSFLNKLKKILILSEEFKKNKDINKTITNARPPIFWKDKDIVREQLGKWKPEEIKKLIFELNEIELQIKKGYSNPTNIISNFIIEKSYLKTNNYF